MSNIKPLNLRSLKECINKYKLDSSNNIGYTILNNDLYLFYYMYLVHDDIDNISNFEEMCNITLQKDNNTYMIDEMKNIITSIIQDVEFNTKLKKVAVQIKKWS